MILTGREFVERFQSALDKVKELIETVECIETAPHMQLHVNLSVGDHRVTYVVLTTSLHNPFLQMQDVDGSIFDQCPKFDSEEEIMTWILELASRSLMPIHKEVIEGREEKAV